MATALPPKRPPEPRPWRVVKTMAAKAATSRIAARTLIRTTKLPRNGRHRHRRPLHAAIQVSRSANTAMTWMAFRQSRRSSCLIFVSTLLVATFAASNFVAAQSAQSQPPIEPQPGNGGSSYACQWRKECEPICTLENPEYQGWSCPDFCRRYRYRCEPRK
jgi:hypothetical protein